MKYKLYNYFRSSASYRVRIALHLKSIPFEYVPVHLLNNGGEQNQDSYSQINQMRQVPSLEFNGTVITQSLAIIDFLDRTHVALPLFPSDPVLRAHVLSICEDINSGVQPLHNLSVNKCLESRMGKSKEDVKDWNCFWIKKGLDSLEKKLSGQKGQFCFGSAPTAADAFLIPQLFSAKRFGVDYASYARLASIYDSCLELEAFKKAAPEAQVDYTPT